MLFSLISEETPTATNGPADKEPEPSNDQYEDFPANPEPDEALPLPVPATPQVMEELPSKSDFDNLLGVGSSDATVEVLEDTLDTSEIEATFVANRVQVDEV